MLARMPAPPLAEILFALALERGHPGQSPYSFESVPECGVDARNPSCEIRPLCNDSSPSCRPPRYSVPRGGWVRTETRETATRRFAKVARSLSDTAQRLVACDRSAREGRCTPIGWPSDARSLSIAALTVVFYESGLREDVMFGHPPLGRGPAGEACLMQVALSDALSEAHWLTPDQRAAIAPKPAAREAFARSLLGDSSAGLSRCFEVGMRLLARARRSCGGSGKPWDIGMFAMYGTGKTCTAPAVAERRAKTFRALSGTETELAPELRRWLDGPPPVPEPKPLG
jgi:hypothetical protein